MLQDLIMELVIAVTPKAKERAYKRLEKIGVDRIAADAMAAEFNTERKEADYEYL